LRGLQRLRTQRGASHGMFRGFPTFEGHRRNGELPRSGSANLGARSPGLAADTPGRWRAHDRQLQPYLVVRSKARAPWRRTLSARVPPWRSLPSAAASTVVHPYTRAPWGKGPRPTPTVPLGGCGFQPAFSVASLETAKCRCSPRARERKERPGSRLGLGVEASAPRRSPSRVYPQSIHRIRFP
jgi:hypothetical protein